MLPEVGATELLLIAIVALIVVGPKDLPLMLRKLGQFTAKLRGMANDFRASFDEMARQSELDELRREVEAMRRGQVLDQAAHGAGQVEINQIFDDIHQGMSGGGVQLHPPMSHQYETPQMELSDAMLPEPTPAPTPKPRKPRAPRAVVAEAEPAPKPRKPRKAKSSVEAKA